MTSHMLIRSTPKTPKSGLNLRRCITVRVVPYAHKQHIKVPKHLCIHPIWMWNPVWSLLWPQQWHYNIIWDLGSGLPTKPQNPPPDLQRRITVKVDPDDIHMLIHSIYQNTLYTFAMDVGSSLRHAVVVSRMTLQHHLGSELPPKPRNPPLTCRGVSL